MKLDVKALALTFGILWGGSVLLVALVNLAGGGYGQLFLQMLASWYPGYHADHTLAGVIVVTLYALVDGCAGGAVFGWLYNFLARPAA